MVDLLPFLSLQVTSPNLDPLTFLPCDFELRGDVQALRLGQLLAEAKLSVKVFVGPEPKIRPGYFFPGWVMVLDVS